jgi:hypothetical protein
LATTLVLARGGALPNMENSATVTVQSAGTALAAGAVLTVPSPAGFSYEGANCSATGSAACPISVTPQALAAGVQLPALPVGGALTFKLDGVTTGAIGSAVNFSASVALAGDTAPANNSSQRSVMVVAPAAATLVTSVPAPSYPAGSDELAAFNWTNTERTRCGLGLLKQVASLDASAVDHASYLAINADNGNISALTHEQNPSFPGFTGTSGTARANFRGYAGGASDLLGTQGPAIDAYKAIFSAATYHSLTAQGQNADLGLGSRFSTAANAWLVVFNSGSASTQQLAGDFVATYPCNGVTGNRRNHAVETPSPFPQIALQDLVLKGPPITIFVRTGQQLKIFSVLLSGPNSQPLSGTLLTSANRPLILGHQAAFIPDRFLAANTTFDVVISGTNDGQRFEKRFSFSTGN